MEREGLSAKLSVKARRARLIKRFIKALMVPGPLIPRTCERHLLRLLGVILYRSGLVTAAAPFVAAASAVFLPTDSFLTEIIKQNLDLFYILGPGELGLSLVLIHIYVTEIKRTIQALWVLGVVGSLATYTAIARPAGENLVQYVIHNPSAVWPLLWKVGSWYSYIHYTFGSCGSHDWFDG